MTGGLAPLGLEQGHQRVGRRHRIKVEHDAMSEVADGLQCKQLRIDVGLEFEHEAHHLARESPDAYRLDVGIVRAQPFWQHRDFRTELGLVEIDHQSSWIAYDCHRVTDGFSRLEDQPRILLSRPQSCKSDLVRSLCRRGKQEAESRQQQPFTHATPLQADALETLQLRDAANAFRHASPASLCAVSVSARPAAR